MKSQVSGARRVRNIAGALVATGALMLMGAMTPAMATTGGPGPEIPDGFDTGTITIHKFESPTSAPEVAWPNNGTEVTPAPGLTGLNGVTFTVTPVTGVDLTTNAGWTQVQTWAADPGSIPGGNLGTPFTLTTGPSGSITSGTLTMGAYLIAETGHGDHNIVFHPDPFLVTIPLPTTVDGESTWINHIHVYPKNSLTDVTKTVNDTDAFAVGDLVTWSIETEIPGTYGTGDSITSLTLGDVLHKDLRFDDSTVVATLTNEGGTVTTTLVEGTTLTTTVTAPLPSDTFGDTVAFAVAGTELASIADYAGGTFKVTFQTMVTGAPGTIVNVGTATFNDVEFESTPVDTTWAAVRVLKYESNTSPKLGLEGAEFQVFMAATGGTPLSFLVGQDEDGNDVFEDTFTTDSDGFFTIPGLKVGGTYWLEETKAPDRFMQLEDRIPVVGLQATHTIENPLLIEVANTEIPDWLLPLTGGAGTLVPMIGLGMILLATGSALVVTRRGKRIS